MQEHISVSSCKDNENEKILKQFKTSRKRSVKRRNTRSSNPTSQQQGHNNNNKQGGDTPASINFYFNLSSTGNLNSMANRARDGTIGKGVSKEK